MHQSTALALEATIDGGLTSDGDLPWLAEEEADRIIAHHGAWRNPIRVEAVLTEGRRGQGPLSGLLV